MNAAVRAVLWDADGVLQQGPVDWTDAFGRLLGEDRLPEFGAQVFGHLDDGLAGRFDMASHVTGVLSAMGLTARCDEVLAVWRLIDPLPQSRGVVQRLRAAGTPCYLATNQDSLRAAGMRELMGYDDLFDGCYYSCEVGVAKPAPAYFQHIADDLGLRPEQLLFLDDQLENVDSARRLGLRAELWHHRDGVGELERLLESWV